MREQSLNEFVAELSGKAAVPGGGGASALAGSLGVALASMVANLTTGKKKYAQYQADIERILQEAEALSERLLSLIEEDAQAFEPLSKAYGLPKETPEEQAYKEEVMEKALYAASQPPYHMMETAAEAVKLHEELLEKGSVLAVSDVGVGVQMLEAAIKGASLNVYINTRMMKNRDYAKELNAKVEKLLEESEERCRRVYDEVCKKLR